MYYSGFFSFWWSVFPLLLLGLPLEKPPSNATNHMFNDRNLLNNFCTNSPTLYVTVANNAIEKVEGIGSIKINVLDQLNNSIGITLENVLYISTLGKNLISENVLVSKGHTVNKNHTNGTIIDLNGAGKVIIPCIKRGNLTYLNCGTYKNTTDNLESVNTVADLSTWHQRLGHASINMIK